MPIKLISFTFILPSELKPLSTVIYFYFLRKYILSIYEFCQLSVATNIPVNFEFKFY